MDRYQNTAVEKRWDGKRMYRTTRYPNISSSPSDVTIITSSEDYLDSLAFKYYKDSTLWWIIALANNLGNGKLNVPAGLQLCIPMNVTAILSEFNRLNSYI